MEHDDPGTRTGRAEPGPDVSLAYAAAVAPPWSADAIIDWIFREGRHLTTLEEVLEALCTRLTRAGLPLARVGVFLETLHPLYFGYAIYWDGERATATRGAHALQETEEYRLSPIVPITRDGVRVIRRRLEDRECPLDFPVLRDLREEGMTDYIATELLFSDRTRNAVSLATRVRGGFSSHDVLELERILHPFAMVMENLIRRDIARNILETYLGHFSGARVLEGRIRLGDAERIDAVIWFSDLRGSTRLAEQLEPEAYLELLNDYFAATAGSVLAQGGEVLRFVGDASLAVFPIGERRRVLAAPVSRLEGWGEENPSEESAPAVALDSVRAACAAALAAAADARRRAEARNAERLASGKLPFAYGIGLHLGEVLYGNIGVPGRLEFSVVGQAANEAARIEGMCRELGVELLASAPFAHQAPGRWRSLGALELPGVGRRLELFQPEAGPGPGGRSFAGAERLVAAAGSGT